MSTSNVIGMSDWLEAKNPRPMAKMLDLRSRLPVEKALERQASNLDRAGLCFQDIQAIAALLNARHEARGGAA